MKKLPLLLLLLAITFALGIGAYAMSRHCLMPQDNSGRAELEWLRREYKLTDAQYARIYTLHHEYKPICDNFCKVIDVKRQEIESLIRQNKQVSPELIVAMRDEALLRSSCRQTMLAHVYAVSQAMSPEQGQRYLDMMSTQIACPSEMSNRAPQADHSHHNRHE